MALKDRRKDQFAKIMEHWIIFLVLLLALINGGIYLFLVPPWQHYDEPGHLEYAWLIADHLQLPKEGDYDQSMRREMAASMIEYDFFKNLDFKPNLLSVSEPIWIGISQTSGLPLYYLAVALPLIIIHYSDIAFQLYAGRFVSLSFYLITIIAAYGIICEITPKKNPLRWMLPFTLAILPGFTDIMTSVNDDAGATVAFSLFLLAGTIMIQRGFSIKRLVGLLVTVGICVLTKNTVIFALVLMWIPILILILRPYRQRYIWSGIFLFSIVGLLSLFRYGDAAKWIRFGNQKLSTNTPYVHAPIGRNVFQLKTPSSVAQIVPVHNVKSLRGKAVTIGAWIWANKPKSALTPSIQFDGKTINKLVNVGNSPTFFALTTEIPTNTNRVVISLQTEEGNFDQGVVYYDGIVLVDGDYTEAGTPRLVDPQGEHLVWKGQELINQVRNASAETSWWVVRPRVNQIMGLYIPGSPSLYLSLLQDWQGTAWYYQVTLENLLSTFWGKFGWGHVPLIGHYPYWILGLISLAGWLGAIVAFIRNIRVIPWNAYSFLILSGLSIWFFTLARGLTSITEILFIPSARYAYPAIIPSMLILITGWLEITGWLGRKRHPRVYAIIYVALFIMLDSYAIYSIYSYYYHA